MELARKLNNWEGLEIFSGSSRDSFYARVRVWGESAFRPLQKTWLPFSRDKDCGYSMNPCSTVISQPINWGRHPVVVNYLFESTYRITFMGLLVCKSFLSSIFLSLRLFRNAMKEDGL